VPLGVQPGQSFEVFYTPDPRAAARGNAATNSRTNALTRVPFGGLANRLIDKATEVSISKTGKSPEQWFDKIKENVTNSTAEFRSKLTQQMDSALASCDDTRINSLLDSAMAASIFKSSNAPTSVRRAANHVASRQLKAAIASADPKQLKGALVSAKRLHCEGVTEFPEALQKYKEVKKLPPGFDMEKMLLHRKGDKMVAKLQVSEPAVMAKFQRLLDLTHRKVYTRDRQGQPVPDKLELISVATVANDDLWADYMARRETIRQELAKDPTGFREYKTDTIATAASDKDVGGTDAAAEATAEGSGAKAASEGAKAAAAAEGESIEAIAASLAEDFAEPLLDEVNEVFLFHGTSATAADKITTADFNINLAGSSAGTLYGRGIYLAENCTKSDEYTRPLPKGHRHLLLCRAALGRVYYTDDKVTDPRACEEVCLRGRFHSVLGDRKKCRGTFREFVLFDEEQVYPNYILTYKRVEGTVDAKHQMEVVSPPGATPGTTLQVKSPEGTIINVLVPSGVTPGQKFTVQY